MDRRVDIWSQVHGVALHPHVPGKAPVYIWLSLSISLTASKRLHQFDQTTSEGYVSEPPHMGGLCIHVKTLVLSMRYFIVKCFYVVGMIMLFVLCLCVVVY